MGSTKTEKESNTLSGSEISVFWLFVFLYSTLHSLQVTKIIGNVTAKNYLKGACRLFCASFFKEKVLHGKGLILKFILLQFCKVI